MSIQFLNVLLRATDYTNALNNLTRKVDIISHYSLNKKGCRKAFNFCWRQNGYISDYIFFCIHVLLLNNPLTKQYSLKKSFFQCKWEKYRLKYIYRVPAAPVNFWYNGHLCEKKPSLKIKIWLHRYMYLSKHLVKTLFHTWTIFNQL